MADPTNEPNQQQAQQEPDGGQQQAQGQQQQQQAQGQQQEPDGGKAKGIDPHKYQRDIEKRDQRIAELEGQIAEAAKTEEARAKLQAEFDAFKAEQADKDLTHELERAGCVNAKAAKAVLADYDGDVAKLKEGAPYLFGQERKGATGLPPAGASGDSESRREKARKAAGLK